MTQPFGENLCIRSAAGEALRAQPEAATRLEAASAEAGLTVRRRRPEGIEVPIGELADAERIIDNPNVNREAGEFVIDLDPVAANLPTRPN